MVEIERASIPIRADREGDYDRAATDRESAMKRLADRRIAESRGRTLVNVGANHAQKERLRGTDHEWLGDYLVHRSAAAGGSAISVGVFPARVTADYDSPFDDFDIRDASPENELFLVLADGWPGQTVFLPLTDPLFAEQQVAMNYEGTIETSEPARHYDAVVVLPLTHRIPLP